MYGSDVSENITLDMQNSSPSALPTVMAMWLVIVNPVAKIALTLAPVAMALEVGSRLLLSKQCLVYSLLGGHTPWYISAS